MRIAITGVTGNMGRECLREILKIREVEHINLLVLPNDKRINALLRKHRKHKSKLNVVHGNIKDIATCKTLVQNTDIVINLAAVIPPHSDKSPKAAVECNEIGANSLVSAIESMSNQPKLIHISTVALYGNRMANHPFGQIGDPLLVSPYDIYSATKLRGEFRVLESSVKTWVVLRQTAMLHVNMLKDNMSDGLMFHTCYNAPLEWVTAEDSGVLIANILKKDIEHNIEASFWNKCYNIGNPNNRITGFDTLDDGFKIIGGTAKDFFLPNYNATRNFHGMWFYDSNKLNDMFDFQKQDVSYYWKVISKKYWYYKFGKIIPKKVLKRFAIEKLLDNYNSPYYWYKTNDVARMTAYFGGMEKFEAITPSWNDCNLLIDDKDYKQLIDIKNAKLIDYHFDINKDESQISIVDLQNVAAGHGGRLVSTTYTQGDMKTKLIWETSDGEQFSANAYTVLKAGHWVSKIYSENVWEFDRLAQNDRIFAQIWYDSHTVDENYIYSLDENFKARID